MAGDIGGWGSKWWAILGGVGSILAGQGLMEQLNGVMSEWDNVWV